MTSWKSLILGFTAATWIVALQGAASAQVCTSNAGCPKGTSCQATATGTGSVGRTGAADAIAPGCPKDQPDCKGGTGTTNPAISNPATTITTGPEMTCQSVPCTADAECGAGMVCHTDTGTTCSGFGVATPACPPNQVCPAPATPAPVTCTTTSYSSCAFKWQLPCSADSDCGAAFTCKPSVSGTCSGGGAVGVTANAGTSGASPGAGGASGHPEAGAGVATASPSNDGGSATIPPVCTTTTSFPGSCQPKASVCTSDSDCPASWTCVAAPEITPVSTGGPTSAGPTPGAVGAPPDAVPTPAGKVCQSPAGFAVRAVDTTGQTGAPSGAATPPAGQSGSEPGAGLGAKPTSPTAPESNSGAAGSSGGCGMAGPIDASGAPGGLVALGLVLAVRTNRRRRSR